MFAERLVSRAVRHLNRRYLRLRPSDRTTLPPAQPGRRYLLYAHIPFCEQLCPYCSFNRYPFVEEKARSYFADLRTEMRLLAQHGYDFSSLYIGGGTPTILPDELVATIDEARTLYSITEVSCETNPNHLVPELLEQLTGRVQRLSVGVQSFDDGLLRQMKRYDAYGSGFENLERIVRAQAYFDTLNVDMIYNFPSQTEDVLLYDLACILESGVNQVTFYPLMASPSVASSLAHTVGRVDYAREQLFYETICEVLTGGSNPAFTFGSAWAFNACSNANNSSPAPCPAPKAQMIDEYIVDFEEYPAIGSGGLSYLDGSLFVNTFSLVQYHEQLANGMMSITGETRFSKRDRMRYRLMMQLFSTSLDKRKWQRDFGCSVSRGLPAEYAFLRAAGAFAFEDAEKIVLSPVGRYLLVALMREFFISVNAVRDQARTALPAEERCLFDEASAMPSVRLD
ncbi:MAG: coproporphyrinogen III oxidase family protein [Coriobacteriales bacterium]|jgi:coproporphyrinogen III oxidase-like Fe-S oxidoreductase|nr:coproporphyrinogen III oxidase family protein [Coriobacteriales bacterium]